MTDDSSGRIAVVTDSCSDLTPEIARARGITVVPLTLTIGTESVSDGSLTQPEFFRRMDAEAALPTTSQPSVGAFVEAYRAALEHAEHVVSVHVSSKLSGTISSATQAAKEFAGRVHVVDTFNLSWGQGLQVVEAAKGVAEGLSVAAVVERVERARDRVEMIVGLDSLEQLVKGGRISRAAGTLGGVLGVKVLITPKDGALVVARSVRGAPGALKYGMRWIDERMKGAKRGAFAVMHAMSEDSAHWLEAAIRDRYEPSDLYMVETGTVIAVHTGVGWGVAFLPED